MVDLSLEQAYERMARIRVFEERTSDLKTAGEIPGSIHLANGQEAIPVGTCAVLQAGDAVTATYRGHGWAVARGVPLAELFAEMMGRDSALCGGRGGSPYFSAPAQDFLGENSIVGAGVPVALGAALAARVRGDGSISVVSIGDGAMNQGATHEALNFAAAFALPLVVVVENNLYSEMTPVRDMIAIERLAERAAAYGMPGCTIDGNDPFVVLQAAGEAAERARGGGGPSLIEAMTERLVGHYSGDMQAYRPAGEVDRARTREPLVRLRQRIADEQPDLAARLAAVDARVAEEVSAAVDAARARPEPDPATATEHVYA